MSTTFSEPLNCADHAPCFTRDSFLLRKMKQVICRTQIRTFYRTIENHALFCIFKVQLILVNKELA